MIQPGQRVHSSAIPKEGLQHELRLRYTPKASLANVGPGLKWHDLDPELLENDLEDVVWADLEELRNNFNEAALHRIEQWLKNGS